MTVWSHVHADTRGDAVQLWFYPANTSFMCCLIFINSFLVKTAVSDLSSQCNLPSTLAEWIQSARSYLCLVITWGYKWLCLYPVDAKSDVKNVTGRRKGANYKSKMCEIILVPGQWRLAIRNISSICQLGSFEEHAAKKKGNTLKHWLQLSRPKLCISLLCPCAFISNTTGR